MSTLDIKFRELKYLIYDIDFAKVTRLVKELNNLILSIEKRIARHESNYVSPSVFKYLKSVDLELKEPQLRYTFTRGDVRFNIVRVSRSYCVEIHNWQPPALYDSEKHNSQTENYRQKIYDGFRYGHFNSPKSALPFFDDLICRYLQQENNLVLF